jgi:hypothetical protein
MSPLDSGELRRFPPPSCGAIEPPPRTLSSDRVDSSPSPSFISHDSVRLRPAKLAPASWRFLGHGILCWGLGGLAPGEEPRQALQVRPGANRHRRAFVLLCRGAAGTISTSGQISALLLCLFLTLWCSVAKHGDISQGLLSLLMLSLMSSLFFVLMLWL